LGTLLHPSQLQFFSHQALQNVRRKNLDCSHFSSSMMTRGFFFFFFLCFYYFNLCCSLLFCLSADDSLQFCKFAGCDYKCTTKFTMTSHSRVHTSELIYMTSEQVGLSILQSRSYFREFVVKFTYFEGGHTVKSRIEIIFHVFLI